MLYDRSVNNDVIRILYEYDTFTRLLSLLFKNETTALKNFSAKFGMFIKYVDLCLIGVELYQTKIKSFNSLLCHI